MEWAAGASPLAACMAWDRVKVKTATAVQQNQRVGGCCQADDSVNVISHKAEDVGRITGK
jgi:hypothetical protein